MILFCDTTADTYFFALVTSEGRVFRTKKITRNARIGDAVFRAIRTWAGKKGFMGIIVVTGPGRFSGVRHGVTIANTLGFVWGIPFYGVEKKGDETLRQLLTHSLRQKSSQLLIPRYGKEPNITLKK